MKISNLTINLSYFLAFLFLINFSCINKHDNNDAVKSPNIIYILADDLGYGDLQSLNPESKIPTPNMDGIVNAGVHFTDAHSNSAVCTPTRYGILTGRYSFRTRLKSGVLWGYSKSLIESDRVTVASYLKEQGYQTACIGKWHLGLDWAKKDEGKVIEDIQWDKDVPRDHDDNVDYTKYVKGGPADHGFDYSMIIPASLDMCPYCYVRNGYVVDEPNGYTEGKDQKTDGRGVFWRCGKAPEDFDFYKVLPNVVDTACQYINSKAISKSPFFMYLPLPSPHTPWLPTKEYEGKSGAGKYGDYVYMVDDMIGKVVKAVKENGIEENTLIIVTSDNGSDWRPSDIKEWNHRANYIYKGRKADIYEAGHRIPFIAQWKGVIPAGHESNETMCTTDLFGTITGILRTEMPEIGAEDSYNLWPAFIGEASNPIREATLHHSLSGYFSIRKGKWKFTPHLGSGGFSDPKYIKPKQGEAPGTLYDVEADPKELNNLYDEHPELVEELSQLLQQYKDQGYSRVGYNGMAYPELDFTKLIQPIPATAKFIVDDQYTWGGSLVKGEDGKYHMYYSRWPKELKMNAWVTHSEIAHAVSDSPFGPFKFKDVALKPRNNKLWDGLVTHNPTVHKFNGKYYIYYMGTTGTNEKRQFWDFRNKQQIGVAVADNPNGPWTRFDEPVIPVSKDKNAHDALMVSNPSVAEMPDGKYLMVYKAAAKKGKAPMYGPVVHLTAIADSPEGPFIKQNQPIFTATANNEFPAEDPSIWYDRNRNSYFAIVKDMNGAFTDVGTSLVLFRSADGFDWKLSEHPLVSELKLKWENGTEEKVKKLERPQIFFENGVPVALLCASRYEKGHSFNVQIPLQSK